MVQQSDEWEWVKGSELRPGDVVRAGKTEHGTEVFYERPKGFHPLAYSPFPNWTYQRQVKAQSLPGPKVIPQKDEPDPVWERFTRIESEIADMSERFEALKAITLDVMGEVDKLTAKQMNDEPVLTQKIELRKIAERMREHADKLSAITGKKI